ncbi:MAG: hypothetical protein JXA21_03815 [Anaerolineae bacterium]|nr:hypothetical protein [Anaerolineae bacterium]
MTQKSTTSSPRRGCSIFLVVILLIVLVAGARALYLHFTSIAVLPPAGAGCPNWSRQSSSIANLVYTPDGATLLIEGNGLAAYDAVNRRSLWCVDMETAPGLLTVSPDGKTFAAASHMLFGGYELLETRRVTDGLQLQQWPVKLIYFSDLAFTPDGQMLVSSGFDLTRRFLESADTPQTLTGPATGKVAYGGIDFASDGRTMAVVVEDRIELWDTATWTVTQTFPAGKRAYDNEFAFVPDDQVLVMWGGGGVDVLRLSDGALLLHWADTDHDFKYVQKLAFSLDGRYMAALAHGYHNKDLRTKRRDLWVGKNWDIVGLWETANWQLLGERRYSGMRNVLAFSPDGAALWVDDGRALREIPLSELSKK